MVGRSGKWREKRAGVGIEEEGGNVILYITRPK